MKPLPLLVRWSCIFCWACDSVPVPPQDWKPLGVQCRDDSPLGTSGGTQVILESQEALDQFLRRDCLRGEASIQVAQVDFTREVAVFDVARSPLEDGSCVKDREVSRVDTSVDGLQFLYDDRQDPACAPRTLTGGVAILRRHVRAALRE